LLQAYQFIRHEDKKIEKVLKSFFSKHPKNIELSLDRIFRLLYKLGNPQNKLKNVVQVAGTNGKGSISTILYKLQQLNGRKVNIYRSPHLINFNERIHILNKEISNKYLLELLSYVDNINGNSEITFFEAITAAAFFAFSNNNADVTILEVGLGGRLDATNTINKNLISIITTIGMDHKEFLGNSLSTIAKEKVGIIKNKTKVISSKQNQIVRDIILRKAKEQNSKCLMYGEDWKVQGNTFLYNDFKINLSNLSLVGNHQYINASAAILACLISKELEIENLKLEKSINKIKWPGRLHKLRGKLSKQYEGLDIWVDVAHNVLGFRSLISWIESFKTINPVFVIGLGIKKDYKGIIKEIKKTKPGLICFLSEVNFHCHKPEKLKKFANQLEIESYIGKNINDILDFITSKNKTNKKQLTMITGSIGLIGDILIKSN
jgi:dihydrofolate synthase/folylpolyglutamate synthase